MKILLIHQNFPGQYLHLAQYLRNLGGHEIVGLGEAENIKNRGVIKGITTIGYPTPDGAGAKTHMYLQSTEAAVRRGQAVARSLLELKKKGFVPDIVCVHPGWGEGLFVRDIFPRSPILAFCEYYFRAGEADLNFDPEFPEDTNRSYSVRFLNTPQILSILTSNACLTPTHWQASRYPDFVREKLHIIHDGIDTTYMKPTPDAQLVILPMQKRGESRVFGYYLPDMASAPARKPEEEGGAAKKNKRHHLRPGLRPGGHPVRRTALLYPQKQNYNLYRQKP